uniref:Uncharacterized protein n=1 Tax=Pristionchus pacificus TaxID=54126 RepID=A0A2A6BK46_PRIPA|eukprot:PDM66257.1 hypothetical protein PRIPAC_45482 [Pristionchus pacificus]
MIKPFLIAWQCSLCLLRLSFIPSHPPQSRSSSSSLSDLSKCDSASVGTVLPMEVFHCTTPDNYQSKQ